MSALVRPHYLLCFLLDRLATILTPPHWDAASKLHDTIVFFFCFFAWRPRSGDNVCTLPFHQLLRPHSGLLTVTSHLIVEGSEEVVFVDHCCHSFPEADISTRSRSSLWQSGRKLTVYEWVARLHSQPLPHYRSCYSAGRLASFIRYAGGCSLGIGKLSGKWER